MGTTSWIVAELTRCTCPGLRLTPATEWVNDEFSRTKAVHSSDPRSNLKGELKEGS